MADDPIVLGERRARLLVQIDRVGLRREVEVAAAEASSKPPTEAEAVNHVRRVADLFEASARSPEPLAGAELLAWVLHATANAVESGNAEELSAELALVIEAIKPKEK